MARPLPKFPTYTLVCAYCGKELVKLSAIEVIAILNRKLLMPSEILTPSAIYQLVRELRLPDRCPHCGAKLKKVPDLANVTATFKE